MIRLSVVIPTYNRPQALQACLAALETQSLPRGEFEIVVCDDGSDPMSVQEVARVCAQFGARLLQGRREGPAGARNLGAAAALGEFLVFLDDDCVADPDWLSDLAAALCHGTLVAGTTVNGFPDNLPSEVGEVILEVGLRTFTAGPGTLYFFRTTNLAVAASDFRHIGGFDTTFRTAEDREFCDRWQAAQGIMRRADRAVVRHNSYLTLKGFAYRHFTYGQGAYRFHRQRRKTGPPNVGFLTYYLHVFRILGRDHQWRGWLLFALWQVTNLAGFLFEMLRQKFAARHPDSAPESGRSLVGSDETSTDLC